MNHSLRLTSTDSTVSESVQMKNRVFFRHQLTLIRQLKFMIHELKMGYFTDSTIQVFFEPQNLPISSNKRVPNPDLLTALSTEVKYQIGD